MSSGLTVHALDDGVSDLRDNSEWKAGVLESIRPKELWPLDRPSVQVVRGERSSEISTSNLQIQDAKHGLREDGLQSPG